MKRIPPFCFLLFCLTNIIAQSPPIIHCKDTIFSVNEFNINNPNGVCEGAVKLQAAADTTGGCNNDTLFWVVFIDLWGNGSIDLEFSSRLPEADTSLANDTNGNGIPDRHIPVTLSGETIYLPSFTLDAELSFHKVSWKVTNACGFNALCSSQFSVLDKTPPVTKGPPLDTVATLKVDSETELWARSFDRGSRDNCTTANNLLFTFNNGKPIWSNINVEHYFKGDGMTATAAEYNAGNAQRWVPSKRSSAIYPTCEMIYCNDPYTHIISVIDQSGNKSAFEAKIDYFENISFCEPDWLYFKIKSLLNTELYLQIIEAHFTQINFKPNVSSFSNIDGYRLINYEDCYDSFCLKLHYMDSSTRGINSNDFKLLKDHLLGLKKITNPYQLIAADVNADGAINSDDFLYLRKIYYGLIKYDKEKSWFFLRDDQNVSLENGMINYTLDKPCVKKYSSFKLNFIAIKRGDIDGSYTEKK